MKAPHLRQFQFRKPDQPPSDGGLYLSLIPLVALLIGFLAGPYVTGPALRLCTL